MQYLDMTEEPGLDPPVIDGLLRQGETGIVSIPPGVSPVKMLAGLCYGVANGGRWLAWQCEPGPVLVIDTHQRTPRLKADLHSAGLQLPGGIGTAEADGRIVFRSLSGSWSRIDRLADDLAANHRPGDFGLIVLNTLNRPVRGRSAPLNRIRAQWTIQQLDRIGSALGAAVVATNCSVDDAPVWWADCGIEVLEAFSDKCWLRCAVTSFPPVDPVCVRTGCPAWEVVDPAPETAGGG